MFNHLQASLSKKHTLEFFWEQKLQDGLSLSQDFLNENEKIMDGTLRTSPYIQ